MASYNIETLDTEAKKRYKNKLEMIGMINCPYMLPADIWTNDPTNWSPISGSILVPYRDSWSIYQRTSE